MEVVNQSLHLCFFLAVCLARAARSLLGDRVLDFLQVLALVSLLILMLPFLKQLELAALFALDCLPQKRFVSRVDLLDTADERQAQLLVRLSCTCFRPNSEDAGLEVISVIEQGPMPSALRFLFENFLL